MRAQICHDADQLECLIQALEYEIQYPEKTALFDDFWPYAKNKISTEPGKRLFNELLQKRNKPQRTRDLRFNL